VTSPADLHAATLARLKQATSITVYDGDVPKSPPADSRGRVYPYAVLWTTAGAPTVERPLTDRPGGLTWGPQVTVAAGDIGWLLSAVQVVRGQLEGARLTPWATLRERTDTEITVQKDPDTSPPRFFLPLYFTTTTA